jgi:hypothetical protein
MLHALAAAGKNIKNVAGNSHRGGIKFQAIPFTSDNPSAYNEIIIQPIWVRFDESV